MTEIFLYLPEFTQGKGSSCDCFFCLFFQFLWWPWWWLCNSPLWCCCLFILSLSSLTVFAKAFLQGDFHVHFFCFCTGVTDTGTCWFCFSAFSGRSCCWGWSSCSVSAVAGTVARPVFISLSDSETFFSPLEYRGSISLGYTPTCCSDLGPLWGARVTAHFLNTVY